MKLLFYCINFMKENFKGLLKEWKVFLAGLLNPATLIFILGAIGLMTYDSPSVDRRWLALIQVMIALASGLAGARIANHVSKHTEQGVLVKMGKSAVRSLKLVITHVDSLLNRLKTFVDRDEKDTTFNVSQSYEEIVQSCRDLQRQVVHSIENWIDIVPEADIKGQIESISELHLKLAEMETIRKSLSEQIEKGKRESKEQSQEFQKLKKQLGEKSLEINKLKNQIEFATLDLGMRPFSLSSGGLLDDEAINSLANRSSHQQINWQNPIQRLFIK